MTRLTIAIPTYNRNEKATRQVARLLEQIEAEDARDIELLVVDNASDVPVSGDLENSGLAGRDCLRIIRNPANVGLAANLNRCFEHATGDWVWLVGDDDQLLPEAVSIVYAGVKLAGPEEFVRQFSYADIGRETETPWSVYPDRTVTSLRELCGLASDGRFCSHLMFISTAVYRRETYLRRLGDAYHWNNTIAPHLAVIFTSMRAGGQIRLSSEKIVEKRTERGSGRCNAHRIRMGLQTLVEIEGCEPEMHSMFNSLIRHWHGGFRAFVFVPLKCLRSRRPAAFWRVWYFRAAASTKGLLSLAMVLSAIFVVPVGCSRPCRALVARWRGLPDDTIGLDRS